MELYSVEAAKDFNQMAVELYSVEAAIKEGDVMPTVSKPVSDAAWIQISAAASGYVENQGPSVVKYRSATALPAASDTMGHQLKMGDAVGWSRTAAENLYARTITGHAELIITEG